MQGQNAPAAIALSRCKGKNAVIVKVIMPQTSLGIPGEPLNYGLLYAAPEGITVVNMSEISLDTSYNMGIFIITMKKRGRTIDPKIKALREQGALNHHPERVDDPLFLENEFFDARDLVQVKYEMVRRVEAEGQSVTAASAAFGFSRPAFYQAQSILRQDGLPGLIPKKRGPRSGHKLREDVVDYMERSRAADPSLSVSELASQVAERFAVKVHRRTIERALRRREKKRL